MSERLPSSQEHHRAEPSADIGQWSIAELQQAITAADAENRLASFNDVILGNEPPSDELQKRFVLRDVTMGGRVCDVYHWDQDKDGNRTPGLPIHRVFVHIKG